ncbi:MAG: hypothetical protein EAZ42_05405 [Verrucomicrobia bacterium]|nr:MAG: hypothetical protein EAZ42_05405 [Verrucomicrobiota bacterium]
MNHRRNEQPKIRLSTIIALGLGMLLAGSGGVLHAYYKNRQIDAKRQTDAIERRIDQYRLDMRMVDMRMDQLLNRFVIRKKIQENGSALRPISLDVVEEVEASAEADVSVATVVP